jgi:hypothetical protein
MAAAGRVFICLGVSVRQYQYWRGERAMQVKTIAVTYGRKFNLGDYNSANIEASAWADLDEGEAYTDAYEQLFQEVKEAVKTQALPLVRKMTADMQEAYAGLPKELQEEK